MRNGQTGPKQSAAPAVINSGRFARVLERLVTLVALGAGYVLLAQALLTTVEVVARKMFSFSIQGIDELGGYALAITASLGFGYATLGKAHVRVDIGLRLMPKWLRGALHVLASIVLFGLSLIMLWYARSAFAETILYGSVANSPLQTPLWIPQSFWLAGFFIFALTAGSMAFRGVSLLVRREFAELDREFGTPTIEEEIAASID